MQKFIKRLFDIVASLLGLVALSPIMVVAAIAIKIDSEGPAIFKQDRPGLNNKIFKIYKFRSMATGTPNLATDKIGDAKCYLTKVGKFIRKTSIDELPQLWNVLKGDMSLIGPRPALYNQYELIEMRTNANVHTVRPGISGWAQINGRDVITDEQKVAYDKYYVENFSLWFDMKILFITVKKVLVKEGVKEAIMEKSEVAADKTETV